MHLDYFNLCSYLLRITGNYLLFSIIKLVIPNAENEHFAECKHGKLDSSLGKLFILQFLSIDASISIYLF